MILATTRIAVIAVALVTACSDGGAPAAHAPGTDSAQDRLSVIEQTRTIDLCALYGGTDSVDGRSLTVLGPTSVLSCDARASAPERDVEVSVGLNVAQVAPVQEEDWVKHQTIDGVDVSSVSSRDAPNAIPSDELVAWSCQFIARYPDNVTLSANVSAPPDADACAVADEVVRTAMQQYAKRPAHGSTTFPTTVLTGADPCAAVERLKPAHRIDFDVDNFSVSTCAFTIDGGPMMTVSFGYQDPALTQVNPTQFQLGEHRVTGDEASGVFDVVVGPEFRVADKPLVPVVSIVDLSTDMDRIRTTAQAVVDEY